MRTRGWRGRLLVGLSWFVALEFVILAPLKFFPNGAFGWPPYGGQCGSPSCDHTNHVHLSVN